MLEWDLAESKTIKPETLKNIDIKSRRKNGRRFFMTTKHDTGHSIVR